MDWGTDGGGATDIGKMIVNPDLYGGGTGSQTGGVDASIPAAPTSGAGAGWSMGTPGGGGGGGLFAPGGPVTGSGSPFAGMF